MENQKTNGIIKRIDKELAKIIKQLSEKAEISERMASREIARKILRRKEDVIF